MRLNARTAITCPEYLHKTYAPNRFDFGSLATESEVAKEMKIQGLKHEARVVAELLRAEPRALVVDDSLPSGLREEATVSALRNPEVQVIVQPELGECAEWAISGKILSIRSSRPDLLVRRSVGPSEFGTWSPVDIKSHGAFDKSNKSNSVWPSKLFELAPGSTSTSGRLAVDDAMQLAHYQRHLEELGIADDSSWAGIIGRDANQIAWIRLDQQVFGTGSAKKTALELYDFEFSRSVAVVEKAIQRNDDPGLAAPAEPMWDDSAKRCKGCEFRLVCTEELVTFEGSGHVTLLAGVTPKKVTEKFGSIRSLQALSEAADSNGLLLEEKQRARVYLNGTHEVLGGGARPEIPLFDIEIDIDLENSQGVLEELGVDDTTEPDRLYLYGYITNDRTLHSRWEESEIGTFENYDGSREGEHSVLLRMWSYLNEQIQLAQASGKTIGIFHYSPHEITWWRKWVRDFSDLPGTPSSEAMDSFIANYFCDLLPIAKKFVFAPNKKSPICNYSIKTLASLAGFNWFADDAGGANSLLYYRRAIGSDLTEATAAQEWLRKYNMDDVRATMALRNWLRALEL